MEQFVRLPSQELVAGEDIDNYAPLHYIYLLLTCSVSDFHVRVMFIAPHIGIKTCN